MATPNNRAFRIDALVTLLVVAIAGAVLLFDGRQANSAVNTVAAAVGLLAAASVWFRRRNPVAVLLAIAFAHLFLIWSISNEHVLLAAVMVALFTVARGGDRQAGLTVAAGVWLVLVIGIGLLEPRKFFPEFLDEGAIMAVPIAVGDAVRSRADRVRNLIDAEADRRVQAERIRIAQDLHDVVAHGLSIIAIQSGVAAHLIDKDPEHAKEALEAINATGKSSLEELRAMVGVLRSTDDVPLRPTPTDPNDISDLLEAAASASIDVTLKTTGAFPPDVSESCVVALHRITQEALTNVTRHAAGAPTTLSIEHSTGHVEVTISNEGIVAAGGALQSTSTMQSTGVGIIGMKERAESIGGLLRAGPSPNGGFEVSAVLPYNLTKEKA